MLEQFIDLRASLLAAFYFKHIPSMQRKANKAARFFYAKDDIPEVRRAVFKPHKVKLLFI